ncbi:MAG: flagellar filament capping protein FliD [Nitrospirae bacterium]|nr:flagellar filament capping protein FliD [Candidatus Manganitrophaceae bacterium]
MGLSPSGIGSNLDINGIVTSLMEIERRPLLLLDKKEANFQAKLSAYGTLKGAVSSFQTAVKDLNNISKFQSLSTASSDKTIFTATADATAISGTYSIEVSQLAQAQKLAAVGQANTSDVIGSGILTFDFGTISGGTFNSGTGEYTGSTFTSGGSGTQTVTIDNTNNSLSGIRDAINTAKIGITASIINDGGASPYRLSLSADNIGAKNSIKITVTGDAALSNLLAQDPAGTQNLAETVTAQDAQFTIDGISVTKTDNTVTDAIQGVTLNLLKTNIGSTETLSISKNTASVESSVNAFVNAYNTLNTTISDLTAFNSETNVAGFLQADRSALSVQRQIRQALTASITALSGSFNTLSDIGVSFQKNGALAVDSSKLQTAVSGNFNDIAGLFATVGTSSDSLVNYISDSNKTQPGSYLLSVDTLATQGKTVGSAAAGLTITSGVNDTLSITVDGGSTTITLAAGSYTAATLATEVQSKINGDTTFSSAGISVAVTESAGVLTITSKGYGAASKVNVAGGNGMTNLLGSSSTATDGIDTVGTINGVTATGFGQFLTGVAGSGAEGIKVQIIGGVTGSRGSVNYSQGYALQLDALADELLGTSGPLSSRTDGIDRQIKDLTGRREVISRRLLDVEARFRRQYTSLDVLLSEMQSTSEFLTQQLDMLNKLAVGRSGK